MINDIMQINYSWPKSPKKNSFLLELMIEGKMLKLNY